MESHRRDAAVAQVLKSLEQAYASRGGRKPMLAVGRDGLMLPIRGKACYREGATATVSVHDGRDGDWGRLPGPMPKPGQETLSHQLTALIEDIFDDGTGHRRGWPTSRKGETIRPSTSPVLDGCDIHDTPISG